MNQILEIKFGSTLYGTRTPDSDTDFKGIYLPTAREIVLSNYKKTIIHSRPKDHCERNTKDGIDVEILSLDRFLEFLMDGQTMALDMLFAVKEVSYFRDPNGSVPGLNIWKEIYNNKKKLLTRNVNAFVGYARQQAAKYGIKGSRLDALKRADAMLKDINFFGPRKKLAEYPTTIGDLVKECQDLVSLEKTPLIEVVYLKGPKGEMDAPHLRINGRSIPFHATVMYAWEVVGKMLSSYGARATKAHLDGGVDWKALSHSCRVNTEALELISTGNITFPRPDREFLIKVKLGQVPFEQVAETIEQGLADLYSAHEKSTLRETPDKKWAEDFVYKVYSDIVKNG